MGDNQPQLGQYQIEVKDFGPIAEARVDLRPLTVFIGPSNTGKSYLAALIYALHQTFGGVFMNQRLYRHRILGDEPRAFKNLSLLRNLIKAERIMEDSEIIPALLKNLFQGLSGRSEILKAEISRCFSVTKLQELIRKPNPVSKRAEVNFHLFTDEASVNLECKIHSKHDPEIQGHIPSSAFGDLWASIKKQMQDPKTDFHFHPNQMRDMSHINDRFFLRQLYTKFMEMILAPINHSIFCLPASRTGVMHSHQALVSALVYNATTTGLRPSEDIPMLPGILGDFLRSLIEMGHGNRMRLRYSGRSATEAMQKLAKEIEKDILQGSVHVIKPPGIKYPSFQYKPDRWKKGEPPIPLMRASSMVSELAPVVLYLRYLVNPGDILIIEEPESHLHPEAQVKLVRHLVSMMRAGIRIIVTTHSEWLLEQFTNLLKISEIPENKRKGIKMADLALDRKDFGAWRFIPKERPRGTVVEEMEIDSDDGGLISDYSEVNERLYDEWADIYNRVADHSIHE